jgi:integrase
MMGSTRKECESIFAKEINDYLNLLSQTGKAIHSIRVTLMSLDKYLAKAELTQKSLSEQIILDWQNTRNIQPDSKRNELSAVAAFSRYLISIGIQTDCYTPIRTRKKRISYIFSSVFAKEIYDYVRLLSEIGRHLRAVKCALRSLDKYLVKLELDEKSLPEQIVSDWLKTLNISAKTKSCYISCIKGFAKYLVSIDIYASCPEYPIEKSEYIPYVFSDAEICQLFDAADNRIGESMATRSNLIFPILFRILYGCGLRINECCWLRWKDVDLDNGVLTILEAKNQKQRLVPMDHSLTETLKSYRIFVSCQKICGDYLFESDRNPGKPFQAQSFGYWFEKVLGKTDIKYIKPAQQQRGICPHCLRHTFTLKSFLKHEDNGERYDDYAPFLAEYLGHDGPVETEVYLRSNYTVYTKSHKRVNDAIGNLFPEVCFEEEN